jgi:hypothetical protein
MPSWTELRLGCQGLYRLVVFDRSFLNYFDRSSRGALRSFGLALLLLPLFLWQVWLEIDQSVPSPTLYFAAKTVAYAYNWILFPFVILAGARLLDRTNEGPGCIAVYNWANVLWTILQLPTIAAMALGIAHDQAALFNLAVFAASIVIEGFLFLVCLRIVLWQAAILVMIDVLLGQTLIWPIAQKLGCTPLG